MRYRRNPMIFRLKSRSVNGRNCRDGVYPALMVRAFCSNSNMPPRVPGTSGKTNGALLAAHVLFGLALGVCLVGALAIGCAGQRLHRGAPVYAQRRGSRAAHHHLLVDDWRAGIVEDDEIGDAEPLAGQ